MTTLRTERILSHIDISNGVGLEIGALTNPVLTKRDANILFADHMSTKDLAKKYSAEPVESDKIVRPDFIIKSSLSNDIRKQFDYVLASHVIEHIPDMVSWLLDISNILKPGGVLSLVIPDKRYTFDLTRDVSRPADVIGAYLDKNTRPYSSVMYDFARNYRLGVSPDRTEGSFKRRYTIEQSLNMARSNASGKDYIDCHCFVFTPYSFLQIVKELITLDLFPYEVVGFYGTDPGELEFFVSLRKTTKRGNALLKTIPQLDPPISIETLNKELDDVYGQLHDILSSRSWKVTAPLRKLVSFIRR